MNDHSKIRRTVLAGALLIASVASGQAPPQPEPPTVRTLPGEQVAPTFESVDVNKDSLISEQEATSAKAITTEAFASMDTNQDGFLTREEFGDGA
ncbi:MAG: hypothetical protein ACREVN_13705 [Gammaproteobacteria bacterium]